MSVSFSIETGSGSLKTSRSSMAGHVKVDKPTVSGVCRERGEIAISAVFSPMCSLSTATMGRSLMCGANIKALIHKTYSNRMSLFQCNAAALRTARLTIR